MMLQCAKNARTIAPSKFPDNAEKKKLQTKAREDDPLFTVEMYVVSGEETAKQAVLWLKKFDETFLLGRTLTGPMYLKLYNHLQALTKDKALQVVTSAYAKLKAISELVPEDDGKFETTIFKTNNRVDSPIAQAILEPTFNTANKVCTMTDKKEFHMACYKEAMWKLSILFFGNDPYGRNSSLGLKRLMSKLTPDPRMGMDKYKRQMAELDSYLPFTLCKAAYKKSKK